MDVGITFQPDSSGVLHVKSIAVGGPAENCVAGKIEASKQASSCFRQGTGTELGGSDPAAGSTLEQGRRLLIVNDAQLRRLYKGPGGTSKGADDVS